MREYLISDFGARPDGTNCANAIADAISSAAGAGGGVVVVPPGRWHSGTIELKSNIELRVEAGAVLVCILDPDVMRGFSCAEYYDMMPVSFFIGAAGAENVTISGKGEIYGQGELTMIDDHTDGGFDESPLGFTPFRPKLSLFIDCENLTVRDITLREAASWTLHMAGCRHVRVDGIRILNSDRGANNDGIDPDCCQDVKITNCVVTTGDDAIVIKTGRRMVGRFGPCRDILIDNCTLHSRDSALKIGTETHADIENIIFSNCVARDCSRVVGIWARDGATISNIRVTNVFGSCRRYASASRYPMHWWGRGEPIFISAAPRNEESPIPGKIRNIFIENLTADCESSLFISGEEGCEVSDIYLNNVALCLKRQGTQPTGLFDEQPSTRDFREHDIPAVYLNRANNVTAHGLSVKFEDSSQPERWSGILEAENCENLDFSRISGNTYTDAPAALLHNTSGVDMSFWRVRGTNSLAEGGENITVHSSLAVK